MMGSGQVLPECLNFTRKSTPAVLHASALLISAFESLHYAYMYRVLKQELQCETSKGERMYDQFIPRVLLPFELVERCAASRASCLSLHARKGSGLHVRLLGMQGAQGVVLLLPTTFGGSNYLLMAILKVSALRAAAQPCVGYHQICLL
jgi:hypothetical protein